MKALVPPDDGVDGLFAGEIENDDTDSTNGLLALFLVRQPPRRQLIHALPATALGPPSGSDRFDRNSSGRV